MISHRSRLPERAPPSARDHASVNRQCSVTRPVKGAMTSRCGSAVVSSVKFTASRDYSALCARYGARAALAGLSLSVLA